MSRGRQSACRCPSEEHFPKEVSEHIPLFTTNCCLLFFFSPLPPLQFNWAMKFSCCTHFECHPGRASLRRKFEMLMVVFPIIFLIDKHRLPLPVSSDLSLLTTWVQPIILVQVPRTWVSYWILPRVCFRLFKADSSFPDHQDIKVENRLNHFFSFWSVVFRVDDRCKEGWFH